MKKINEYTLGIIFSIVGIIASIAIIILKLIRKENLIPTAEQFDSLYEELVGEHLNYYLESIYDEELAAIKNDADRQARILEIKEEMMEYYGEEYFTELTYYEFAYDDVTAFANIK